MGYEISVDAEMFSFDRNRVDDIAAAIKNGIINKEIKNSCWASLKRILNLDTLEEMFDEFGFYMYLNESNDTYKIEFSREKLDEFEEELFKCIAPYVNDGYLEYLGEDGEKWRYVFKDGVCKEIYPRVEWDD